MNRPGRLKHSGHGVVVGLVQLKLPIVGTAAELAAQTRRLCGIVERTKRENRRIDLIVFPEYALHGISMNADARLMCRRDGMEVTTFRAACRDQRVWGCFPFLEYNPHGKPFNSAVLVDDNGEIRIHYRKLHPWTPVEPWQSGNLGIPVCDGPNGARIALTICNDGMFPETARECARKGANLMLRMSGYTAPIRQAWRVSNQVNSMYNMMATASVSLADGPSMMNAKGAAMVVNFDGVSLAEGNGLADEVVTAEIRPDLVDAARQTAGMDDNLYQFGNAGFVGTRAGETSELAARRYLLPWEDQMRLENAPDSNKSEYEPDRGIERRRSGTRG